MKEGLENKINIFSKNNSKLRKGIKYLSKITMINQNVFIIKNLSKRNLTNNFKYKI